MIDNAANLYRGEVAAEQQRWGGERPAPDKWEADVNAMKSFAGKRGKDVVDDLKQLTLTQEQIQMLEDAIK